MSEFKEKIFIVDDNVINNNILRNILGKVGYETTFITESDKAIEVLLHESFDLILLDIMMPGKDGFDLALEINANPQIDDIPIIFLTARSDTESKLRAFSSGGVDYISKPFIKEELLARVRSQINLRNTRKKLVIANKSKDKFLSIIAHDLKSPISTFKNITAVLLKDYNDFEREDILDFIQKLDESANNIYKLLEDLLEWSRAQNDRLIYEPNLILLNKLIENCLDILINTADKKEINIINKIDKDIFVFIDLKMISTVLRNLISNAIKFTHHNGTILIDYKVSGDFVIVSINDNGIGIKEEHKEKLFRIDSQHTTIGTDDEIGTGLGLLLCKEFVERNKGKIWFDSEYGKGTTFYFTIPKNAPDSFA